MQSLAMLNDPQILEAARFTADRMMREAGADLDRQLALGYRLVTGRAPKKEEAAVIRELYAAEVESYSGRPDKVAKLLSVGTQKVGTDDSLRLAALSNVVLTMMNTDEFMTRK